jgi:6-phosphogluconate dehydrogenase
VTHVGPDGAGHFVKMVHNGIEYADMQLMAESWDLLRRYGGMSADQVADVFDEWNRGPLESFLVELTARVSRTKDAETGQPLVDRVLDKAGQKGTGKWTAQIALQLAVPVPTIAAAIDARVLSSMKSERVSASARLRGPASAAKPMPEVATAAAGALLAGRICAYAQGMALIGAASREYAWQVDRAEVARIWKAGCIIRARLLDPIREAFTDSPELPNLMIAPPIAAILDGAQESWRRTIAIAASAGIPMPAHASALAYFDSYRTARLPQSLTQAQRDAFGAHTYERIDRPGAIHSEWQ